MYDENLRLYFYTSNKEIIESVKDEIEPAINCTQYDVDIISYYNDFVSTENII